MLASVAVPYVTALGTKQEDSYGPAVRQKETLYCVRIIKIVMIQGGLPVPSFLHPTASSDTVSVRCRWFVIHYGLHYYIYTTLVTVQNCWLNSGKLIICNQPLFKGAQLVEVLRYKLEGHGFYS
jgi:hypothetical protein